MTEKPDPRQPFKDDPNMLLCAFIGVIFAEMREAARSDVKITMRERGEPKFQIPRIPKEFGALNYHDDFKHLSGNNFALLLAICDSKQHFVDTLSAATMYIRQEYEVKEHQIDLSLWDLDLSDTTIIMNFSHFKLSNINFNGCDLTTSRFRQTEFKKPHKGKPGNTFYDARIDGCILSEAIGSPIGCYQSIHPAGFGMLEEPDPKVSVSYPKPNDLVNPFRLFIGSNEIMPADLIALALFLVSPEIATAYHEIHNEDPLKKIAEAKQTISIFKSAFETASRQSRQSALSYQKILEHLMISDIPDYTTRHKVMERLCTP